MPYELLEEKISKIPLQYLQELIDFADFLIAKENKSSANVRKSCFWGYEKQDYLYRSRF